MYKMHSVGNIVNKCMISLYGNILYLDMHSDHFEMYRNIELLCCVTGTNTVLQASYTLKTSKQIHLKIKSVVTRGRGRGRENWMKAVKSYKLKKKKKKLCFRI